MPKISDEDLAKLKAANPRGVRVLHVVRAPADPEDGAEESAEAAPPAEAADPVVYEFVFRKIARPEFQMFRAQQRKAVLGQGPGDVMTILARSLLLWPKVEEFDALRDLAPAICEDFGDRLYADADAGFMVVEGKR